MELLLFCGVLVEEQQRRQPFRFDLDLYLDLRAAGESDDLSATANYGAVIDQLTATLHDEQFALLERLATRTCELVLETAIVQEVTVKIHKLRPPVAANVESTGVRIHRSR